MNWRYGLILLAALLPGCRKVPVAAPEPPSVPATEARAEEPARLPVVPVETRPFEEGYEAGYAKGQAEGKVGAKVPPASAAGEIARAEAGDNADRTERWQRGFVDGYLDGFRKVVTGQK